jgi:uncharacterized membrane protein YgcG
MGKLAHSWGWRPPTRCVIATFHLSFFIHSPPSILQHIQHTTHTHTHTHTTTSFARARRQWSDRRNRLVDRLKYFADRVNDDDEDNEKDSSGGSGGEEDSRSSSGGGGGGGGSESEGSGRHHHRQR